MAQTLQHLAKIVEGFFLNPFQEPEPLRACKMPGCRDEEHARAFDARVQRAVEEKIRTRKMLIARGRDPDEFFQNRTGEFHV